MLLFKKRTISIVYILLLFLSSCATNLELNIDEEVNNDLATTENQEANNDLATTENKETNNDLTTTENQETNNDLATTENQETSEPWKEILSFENAFFTYGLLEIRKENPKGTYQYGFMNKKGEWVIDCIYDYVENLSEGIVYVYKDGKYSFIDVNGKIIKQLDSPYIEYIEPFNNSYAYVYKYYDKLYHGVLIDKNGTIFDSKGYNVLGGYNEGLIPVEKDGVFGYVDINFNMILKLAYEDILDVNIFNDGYATLRLEDSIVCIDKSGNEIFRYYVSGEYKDSDSDPNKKYHRYYDSAWISKFSNYHAIISGVPSGMNHSRSELISIDGEILGWSGQDIYALRKGLILRSTENPYSLDEAVNLDMDIEILLGTNNSNYTFGEELFVTFDGERYGYVNAKGDLVFDYIFEDARAFRENMAPVKMNGKWGYIDKQLRLLIDYKYDEAWPFSEGVAVATKGDTFEFIENPLQSYKSISVSLYGKISKIKTIFLSNRVYLPLSKLKEYFKFESKYNSIDNTIFLSNNKGKTFLANIENTYYETESNKGINDVPILKYGDEIYLPMGLLKDFFGINISFKNEILEIK